MLPSLGFCHRPGSRGGGKTLPDWVGSRTHFTERILPPEKSHPTRDDPRGKVLSDRPSMGTEIAAGDTSGVPESGHTDKVSSSVKTGGSSPDPSGSL